MFGKITTLTGLSLALMLTNLATQAAIAIFLGAGPARDALFVAMSIPLFLNTLVIASVGTVATPSIIAHGAGSRQQWAADRLLVSVTTVAVVLALTLYLCRGGLVELLSPGFGPSQRELTRNLFTYTLAIIPFQAATSVLSAYWLAVERVLWPSFSLLLGNIFTVSIIAWIGQTLSATQTAISYFGGAALVCLIQGIAYAACRHTLGGVKPDKQSSGKIRHAGRQSVMLMLLGAVSRSTSLIERRLASNLNSGTISCLGYAGYVISFLVNATATPTATAYYSKLCRDWTANNHIEIKRFMERGLTLVVGSCLLVSGLIIILMEAVLNFLLPHTRLTAENGIELQLYIYILLPAYLCLASSSFVSRLFYISGRFIQAAMLDCAALVIYIVFAFGLAAGFGGRGLAAATTIYALVLALLVFYALKKSIGFSFSRTFWLHITEITIFWILVCWVASSLHCNQGDAKISLTAVGVRTAVYICIIALGILTRGWTRTFFSKAAN
jgi:putative peptidoglycan lipid II flippase